MTPQHWQQVKQLFQSALQYPPDRRAAFLDEACASDPTLRGEVDSLISSYDQADDSIEAMAGDVAAQILADDRGSFIGKNIGSYKIISEIGSGAMGNVFLAEDPRLNRRVALKLLPAEFAENQDRLRRFQREARAVSALNHPNILTIHEVGRIDSLNFIVAEFIEGETLRNRIRRQRLPVREALGIAIQIASALAAAHKAGIVHRDVKPENIMLREDGIVKVLDFGLAKLTQRQLSATDTEAPTLTTLTTDPGTMMGTVNYMSPEQARGLEVDECTDIFSLGVLIYEMVTGKRPFEGDTSSDVIAALLMKQSAPMVSHVSDVPAELEKIVRKCLEKDCKDRYRSAEDLLNYLEHSRRNIGSGAALPATPKRNSRAERIVRTFGKHKLDAVAALAVVVLTVTSVAPWLMSQPEQPRAQILTQLTTDTGLTTDPDLSSDGKVLAYASDRSGQGNLDIWVRQIDGGEPIRMTKDPADEFEPTFSPDGTVIAFRSEREGGGIYIVSALGGAPRKIADEGRRPRFSPDGGLIAYWSGTIGAGAAFSTDNYCRIYVVASIGGPPRQVRPDFVGAAYPEWAPDGKHLLFLGNRDEKLPVDENIDWWVTSLDDEPAISTGAFRETRKAGLSGPLLVYPWALIASGWDTRGDSLIFSARSGDSRNLWRIGISPKTWKVTGPPQRLTYSSTIEESPSVASVADGSVKIAFASLSENTDIWSLPFDADAGKVTGELRQLTRDSAEDFHPSLSPDGRKMVWVSARSGKQEIWIEDIETGQDAALTASGVDKYHPNFSPDGMQVSFAAHRENKWDVYVVHATGGDAEMICEDCGQATGWSPDGRYLIGNHTDGRLFLLDVASRRQIDFLTISGRWFCGGTFSPDGRWITFQELGLSRREEHIAPFLGETRAPESAWISVLAELSDWSPAGTMVYGWSDCRASTKALVEDIKDCLRAQRVDQTTKRPLGPPLMIFDTHAARSLEVPRKPVIPGRAVLLLTLPERTSNIWMAHWPGRS